MNILLSHQNFEGIVPCFLVSTIAVRTLILLTLHMTFIPLQESLGSSLLFLQVVNFTMTCWNVVWLGFGFFKTFYLFLERRERGEKKRVRNVNAWDTWWVTSCRPPAGDLAPGMCPDWESNQRPFGLKASSQSTEPHQPELYVFLFGTFYLRLCVSGLGNSLVSSLHVLFPLPELLLSQILDFLDQPSSKPLITPCHQLEIFYLFLFFPDFQEISSILSLNPSNDFSLFL